MMHELIVNDWLDHDYLAQHTLGWEACANARCAGARSAPARSAACRRRRSASLARDWGTTEPAAIRLNYGMQRVRGGGNAVRAIACLPALTGAWRASRRRRAAVELRHVPGRQARRCSAPTCWPAARRAPSTWAPSATTCCGRPRRSSAPGSRRSSSTTATRWRWRRSRRRWWPASRARTCSPWCWSTSRPTRPTTPTTSCRPPPSWSTGTCTCRTATPTCCSIARRSRRWARRGPTPQIFRELAQRMGFDEPCFAEDDESLCRRAFGDRVDFDRLLDAGLRHARSCPMRRSPTAAFPTASGKCEFFSERLARAGPGRPAGPPAQLRGAPDRPARYPLAMISPPARNFLNSSFVNVRSLRDIEGEPLLEIHAERRRRARHRLGRRGARLQRPRRIPLQGPGVGARPPRRGQRPGHLVAQARDWTAPTSTSSPASSSPTWAAARCSTTAWSKSRRREEADC